MMTRHVAKRETVVLLLLFVVVFPIGAQPVSLTPSTMSRMGTVDERFQSYNVEMVEVAGGRFWKPYDRGQSAANTQAPARQPGSTLAGIDPSLFEYRPPIDLSNVRLRQLAAALGPTYVRVSGTWANTIYFHDSDDPAPEKALIAIGIQAPDRLRERRVAFT